MAFPAIAAAAGSSGAAAAGTAGSSSAASSAAASAALSAGVQAGTGILGSLVQAPFAKRRQKRNFEQAKQLAQFENELNKQSQLDMADYNQKIYEKNRAHDEARQDYLNLYSKKIEADALRLAGFNPAWSQQGAGNIAYQPSSFGGTASAPNVSARPFDYGSDPMGEALGGLFGGIPDFFDKMYDLRLKDAEINLKNSQANNLDSDTETKDLNNTFLGDTLALKAQMTKGEYEQALKLQGYFAENPELLKAVADKQYILNQKMMTEISKMESEMDAIASAVGRNKAEERLANERSLTEQLNRVLSKAQLDLMQDKNFRDNYSNPSYLINKSFEVEHSDLSDDEKNDQLAIIRQCLEENSVKQSQQREHTHQSAMQNRDLRQARQFQGQNLQQRYISTLVNGVSHIVRVR